METKIVKIDGTIRIWRHILAKISATLTFTIAPALGVTTASFNGVVGEPISGSVGPVGGVPPDSVTVTDPTTLPPGVTVGSDGTVSGTPTAPGTFSVPIVVADSQG